jgi:methanogenic corrinoid protein MtbC1
VDKAVELGARVIGISAMMRTTAHNIRKVRSELERRGLSGRIQLAVGGAVFLVCQGLDREVGGDGTARTAIDVGKLFERLWEASIKWEAEP